MGPKGRGETDHYPRTVQEAPESWLCPWAPHSHPTGRIHVTLVGVDSVKQGLRRHPLDGQPSLGAEEEVLDARHLWLQPLPTLGVRLTLVVFL